MTDFVIVIAAAAMLSNPVPGPGATASAAGTVTAALTAPTLGFRTYPDAASCEQATAAQVAPAGARLVCIPVERAAADAANAY